MGLFWLTVLENILSLWENHGSRSLGYLTMFIYCQETRKKWVSSALCVLYIQSMMAGYGVVMPIPSCVFPRQSTDLWWLAMERSYPRSRWVFPCQLASINNFSQTCPEAWLIGVFWFWNIDDIHVMPLLPLII